MGSGMGDEIHVSVVVCTHSPDPAILPRVLEALRAQDVKLGLWELVVVDNASDPAVEDWIDLSWHPLGRVVQEEELGLTPARIRGVRESDASVIVFVDDDNLLNPDYLSQALVISDAHPHLGAWGGQIFPEFVETPPEWTRPYWHMLALREFSRLALREFSRDAWGNSITSNEIRPCGAGMCVRRKVAEAYIGSIRDHPVRRALDRTGDLLSSDGDTDMALTACDMGLGMGQFTSLRLTHIIPPGRLTEEYLLKLQEGMAFSGILVSYFRTRSAPHERTSSGDRLRRATRLLCSSNIERRMHLATWRGISQATEVIASIARKTQADSCCEW